MMLKVIDSEKEYELGDGECLIVQDRQDPDECVQVDAKEFSEFELKVYQFLTSEGGN
jgi:PHD/YefM family antitoxin component YafN of YafNO toxin-antitoxin module